jgi:hypothetical protein
MLLRLNGKKQKMNEILIKSFCRGVQMLHGGSFFKKRPPWPPEASKKWRKYL